MARYRISRFVGRGNKGPEKECFEVSGKKYVIAFGDKNCAETSDEDVAGYYCNRNFPNSEPDGSRPHYTVLKKENEQWIKVN